MIRNDIIDLKMNPQKSANGKPRNPPGIVFSWNFME